MAEATHGNTSDSFERFIAEFGSEFPPVLDPAAQTVIDLAGEYQRDLDCTPNASVEMRTSIIQDLDSRWPYLTRNVIATGVVQAQAFDVAEPDVDEETSGTIRLSPKVGVDGNSEIRNYNIDSSLLLSEGFYLVEEPQTVGGEYIGQRYLVRLLFMGSLCVSNANGGIWTNIRSIAKPDGVTLESPLASVDYMRTRIRTYLPREAERLKELESLDARASTAERLLKLKGMPFAAYRDNTWRANEMIWLSQYIKYLVNVESDPAPMLFTAKKGARFFEDPYDNQNNLITNDRTTLATFNGDGTELMTVSRINLLHPVPHFQPQPQVVSPMDAKHRLGVALSVRLLSRERGNDMSGMVFLHDILDIQDTRRMLIPENVEE